MRQLTEEQEARVMLERIRLWRLQIMGFRKSREKAVPPGKRRRGGSAKAVSKGKVGRGGSRKRG